MTPQSTPNRPSLSAWRVESLRLTAFPDPSAQTDASAWWEHVVGQPSERQDLQPKKGLRQEESLIEGGKLILSIQPIRSDWLFITAFDPEFNAPATERLVPFPEAVMTFVHWIERWHEVSPPLKRLAFGAILVIPVNNREEGYRQLAVFLPSFDLDPESSSDFVYQINRPQESLQMLGLRINRLSRWSVVAAITGKLDLGTRALQYVTTGEEHAVRLELDINTAQDFEGEFYPEQLTPLFMELVQLGQEIAERGDFR